ncbi:MAG TPA: methyltransferase domain-containing protein [Gemmatales bacterium]|nr:methyltransferase domain-containing protein [Gemmatales bacterium]
MMLSRQLLQIDYDQFQRYAAITVLLKPLLNAWQQVGKPLRILEVGSHALNLFPAFLSPLSIEIVRADLEPQYAGDVGPYVTIEKDQQLPFAKGAFDVVVAMEVLEHIPRESRHQAMKEWSRVSSKGILFTCPNGEAVIDQERRADADFQARHGRVHPWLEEHERFGRPTADEVQSILKLLNLTCHRFNNSPLSEWLPLLLVSEQVFEMGDPELFSRFNEMLNNRPFRACIQEPAYRSIYAGFKSPAIDEQVKSIWLGNRAIRSIDSTTEPETLDPTRLLASRLSQFIIKNRHHEVDAVRLEHLTTENETLRQQLACAEQSLKWLRWEKESAEIKEASRRVNPLNQAELADLEIIGPNYWHVTGSRPTFEWSCEHQRGWHRIELLGQVAPGHNAILTIDYGHGFRDEHIIHIGFWRAGPDRLCVNAYFHHPVVRMRLLPCQKQIPTAVIIEQVAVSPVSTPRVVLEGAGRLTCDFFRLPWLTWKAMSHSTSWLRLGMQLTMKPRGLPIGANSDYQRWLLENRPTPAQRRLLIDSHRLNPSKVVVFLRLKKGESRLRLDATLQSMLRQDACRWEVWCAAEPMYQRSLQSLEAIGFFGDRLKWMNDGPDRGQAGLLNECVQKSNAEWLIQLQAGDVLEPDACLQILEAAKCHPEAALLITDEGHLSPLEGEIEPTFKPFIKPEMLRRQPFYLGQAFAINVPTLLKLGGFNACYEGALSFEYVQRLLQSQPTMAQLNRVLLHYPPRPPLSQAVLKVIARIQEEYATSDCNISYERIAWPTERWDRGTNCQALSPARSRKDEASC